MADAFNVTGAYDKSSYVGGETIRITISGDDVLTSTSQSQIGPIVIPLVAQDGAQSTITMPAEQATITSVSHLSVTIDPAVAIVDNSPTPRTWTLSTDKLSISAVA